MDFSKYIMKSVTDLDYMHTKIIDLNRFSVLVQAINQGLVVFGRRTLTENGVAILRCLPGQPRNNTKLVCLFDENDRDVEIVCRRQNKLQGLPFIVPTLLLERLQQECRVDRYGVITPNPKLFDSIYLDVELCHQFKMAFYPNVARVVAERQ